MTDLTPDLAVIAALVRAFDATHAEVERVSERWCGAAARAARASIRAARLEAERDAARAEVAEAWGQAEMWRRQHHEATETSREYQARAEGAEAALDAAEEENERLRERGSWRRASHTDGVAWCTEHTTPLDAKPCPECPAAPGVSVSAEQVGEALRTHAPIGRAWYNHPDGTGPVMCAWLSDFLAALGVTVTDGGA